MSGQSFFATWQLENSENPICSVSSQAFFGENSKFVKCAPLHCGKIGEIGGRVVF